MGWVVKEVRFDLADAIRADAERDARRVRRAAARTARDVAAELAVLEQLATDLRRAVRRRRATVAPARAGARRPPPARLSARPATARAAAPRPAPATPGASSARRDGRASMRSSPLAELFRATDARGARRSAA
jgi:hypothetical protein